LPTNKTQSGVYVVRGSANSKNGVCNKSPKGRGGSPFEKPHMLVRKKKKKGRTKKTDKTFFNKLNT